jgi:hypothetical protein
VSTDTIYTPREGVQVKTGNRWRNGEVAEVRQRGGFTEVIVQYDDRGHPVRLLMDAASPFLRKWGEGKLAKERKPMKGYKPPQRFRRGRKR